MGKRVKDKREMGSRGKHPKLGSVVHNKEVTLPPRIAITLHRCIFCRATYEESVGHAAAQCLDPIGKRILDLEEEVEGLRDTVRRIRTELDYGPGPAYY